jgi:putative ABC transport system ATP-binding protein
MNTATITSPAIQFNEVEKRFGSGDTEMIALRGVSLSIAQGEFVAVTGSSGSGKSTLLHVGAGIETVSAGQVMVNGQVVHSLNADARAALRRREIGVVFQSINLVSTLSALENVMLPLEVEGVKRSDAQTQAVDALERVGISMGRLKRDDRYPDQFSGGQQQRIAIARAIVGDRTIVLADEPTGALDSLTSDRIMELLAGLVSEQRIALMLVTHEPRFAAWADRIIRMRDGVLMDSPSIAPIVDGAVQLNCFANDAHIDSGSPL